jgi:hypothetical protein
VAAENCLFPDLKGCSSCVNDCAESFRVTHGQLCKHAAIQLDTGLTHAMDETAVTETVSTDGSVDSDDPKAAKCSFSLASVAVSIAKGPLNSLNSAAIQTAVTAPVTLSKFQNSIMASTGLKASFYAWHLNPPWSYALGFTQAFRARPSVDVFVAVQPLGSNLFTRPASPEVKNPAARNWRLRLLLFFVKM